MSDARAGDGGRTRAGGLGQRVPRFPRLFQGHESIPGLTWPTTTFSDRMTVYLGKRQVEIRQTRPRAYRRRQRRLGARSADACSPATSSNTTPPAIAATAISATGGQRSTGSPPYDPQAIAPGRGDALVGRESVDEALAATPPISSTRPIGRLAEVAARGGSLKEAWDAVRAACDPKFGDYAIYEHCLPFNVARAYDEARGIDTPRIWTVARDLEMWAQLQR